MKILVFGGTGFLGGNLTSLLKQNEGYEIKNTSRNTSKGDYSVDIAEMTSFNILPRNYFDVIVNCATILPGGNYLDEKHLEQIYRTNILGSQNICKWIAKQSSVKKIINCSTLSVANKPWALDLDENCKTYPLGKHVIYNSSKLMQELIFQSFSVLNKVELCQIRFSSLYGKGMKWNGVICNFLDQVNRSDKIILRNGNMVSVDFLHVSDAATIVVEAIKHDITGILNGCSGIETTLLELAEEIKHVLGGNIIIENEDEDICYNRAVINTEKLEKVIDIRNFKKLSIGIKEMLKV